jgi:hypothetical protein
VSVLRVGRLVRGAFVVAALLSCSSKPASLSPEERSLAARVGFSEAVLLEARRHAVEPIVQLDGLDEDLEARRVDGVSFAVPSDEAERALATLRPSLARQGYFAFRYESHFGHGPDRLAILKTTDQFDALRTMSTNGVNYGLEPSDVLARLREWHDRYGLAIKGAGGDFVEATFVTHPRDMRRFAEEVYAFCPDVVEQGTETVEALAEEMQRENTLYLWWD